MARDRDNKRPGFTGPPPKPGKVPAAGADPNAYTRETPLWSFLHVDTAGCQFSFEHCTPEALCKIFDLLRECERKTWLEIYRESVKGKKRNGTMPVTAVCAEAQARFAQRGLDQWDELVKLRVTSAGRLWGVRSDRVLHIVWWDPEHLVYPMNLADN